MPTVASVRLRYVPKDYWFDPQGVAVEEGDHVVVDTERGQEIGICIATGLEVREEDLHSPLKPILRVATEEDFAKADELAVRGEEAMQKFRELVAENELEMKPVSVEFMVDGAHATFYFTADERVDFRNLVRDLASEFHVRVDMRQIGVRDEARILGGLGHCGEELCCVRMGGEFQPVSIRMAKEQDLPLNPTKISGLCGRLMCCLRYEFEAYKDFKGRAPKKNALIDTPMGLAKVVEFDTPRENVRVRFEDGKSMMIPLESMDTGDKQPRQPGEKVRPCHVSQAAFDKIIEDLHNDKTLAMMGDKLFSDDPNLEDVTAQSGSIERTPRRRRKGEQQASAKAEPSTRRSGTKRAAEPAAEPAARTLRRRRRSVSATGEELSAKEPAQGGSADETASASQGKGAKATAAERTGKPEATTKKRRRRGSRGSRSERGASAQKNTVAAGEATNKPRPGQHSSSLSPDARAAKLQGEKGASETSQPARKRRRRRSRNKNKGDAQQGAPKGSAD